ncbi:MAG: UbiD family decarboxylase [Magnetococcales bacterium]|nr:UbiD family decarboxylase [Magnetococcales bacterium]
MQPHTPTPRSFRDLREFMAFLRSRGLLIQVERPVDPRLEMTAIARRLLERGGPAVLFTRPVGHAMPVLANLFGTEERVGLAIGRRVAELEELGGLLAALRQPEAPRSLRDAVDLAGRLSMARHMPVKTLSRAPCREVVLEGGDVDLSRLPIMTCWPKDAGPLITWGVVVTRGLAGGPINLGVYRMQWLGGRRLIMRWLAHRGGAQHLREFGGRPMPVSVVLGCDPGTLLSAVIPVPESLSEYAFAGLLREQRVECAPEHSPFPPVPAWAEIVLEGMVDPADLADEGPFGDHTGYYNDVEPFPVFTVQRMTMRRDPVYLSTFTGRPPDEPAILAVALNRVFSPLLKKQFPEIRAFHLPMEACSYRVAVIGLQKEYPGHAFRVMTGLWGFLRQFLYVKYIFVVDADVPVADWGAVLEAVARHAHGGRDLHILKNTPIDYLDFSSPWSGLGGKMGVDATRKLPVEQGAAPPMAPLAPEDWLERARVSAPWIVEIHSLAEGRMVVARVTGSGPARGVRAIEAIWQAVAPGGGADRLWVVDEDTRCDCLADLAWSLATRTDPGRDVMLEPESGRFAIDATVRGVGETGRRWGEPLVMDPAVEAHVARHWRDYGLL